MSSGVVRIAEELLPKIDSIVDSVRDDFGILKYSSRKDFVDEAVKDYLRKEAPTCLAQIEEVPVSG